ncbi:MAG TPA: DUF4124 domain-containing protein [Burkholderiales bacterium]|nr:DUF4124 domain-containing protein [Burkholderiales bacterium]
MMRSIATGAVLLAASVSAGAQIFECTDAQGNKEFAQVCPPGTVQQKQRSSGASSPAAPAGDAPASKSIAEQEAEFRKRALEKKEAEAKAAKDAADAQKTEEECNKARANLEALETGQRITIPGANGERTYLEDADRPAQIASAKEAVNSWCNRKK